MMSTSAFFRSGSKFAIAIIFFLFSIEVCARIDDAVRYGAPFWDEYSSENMKKTDSDGIPFNIPQARFEKWRHNSLGFRGPELSLIKPPSTLRVVCLGASESYGLYESPGMEWPAQLQTMLPGSKYQVINASVAGMGLQNFEAYSTKHILPLKPDIVIIIPNPFIYASSFERKRGIHALPTKISATTDKMPTRSIAVRIFSNFRCLPKIKQALRMAVQNDFPNMLKYYQLRSTKKQIEAAEMARLGGRQPNDTVSDAAVISFKNDLSSFVSFLESRRVTVILCTYPSLMGRGNLAVYPEIFLDNRKFFIEFSLMGMIDVQEKFNSVITAVSKERGTMLLDCQSRVPKTDEYFGDNVHYTDRGARVIAESIAEKMVNWSDVPPSPIIGSDIRSR